MNEPLCYRYLPIRTTFDAGRGKVPQSGNQLQKSLDAGPQLFGIGSGIILSYPLAMPWRAAPIAPTISGSAGTTTETFRYSSRTRLAHGL